MIMHGSNPLLKIHLAWDIYNVAVEAKPWRPKCKEMDMNFKYDPSLGLLNFDAEVGPYDPQHFKSKLESEEPVGESSRL